MQSDGLAGSNRSRLPASPSDLMLRMVNVMVDGYLELRRAADRRAGPVAAASCCAPARDFRNWGALMVARRELHPLEDLCEEQRDAMQDWLDTAREQPPPGLSQAERDGLIARARDVLEHIERVVHQVRRMEQGAETVVQIHFSAQSHRTNDIMRTLTALTAIFLPLNLITGVFGMNFARMPLLADPLGFWVAMGSMVFAGAGAGPGVLAQALPGAQRALTARCLAAAVRRTAAAAPRWRSRAAPPAAPACAAGRGPGAAARAPALR